MIGEGAPYGAAPSHITAVRVMCLGSSNELTLTHCPAPTESASGATYLACSDDGFVFAVLGDLQ